MTPTLKCGFFIIMANLYFAKIQTNFLDIFKITAKYKKKTLKSNLKNVLHRFVVSKSINKTHLPRADLYSMYNKSRTASFEIILFCFSNTFQIHPDLCKILIIIYYSTAIASDKDIQNVPRYQPRPFILIRDFGGQNWIRILRGRLEKQEKARVWQIYR